MVVQVVGIDCAVPPPEHARARATGEKAAPKSAVEAETCLVGALQVADAALGHVMGLVVTYLFLLAVQDLTREIPGAVCVRLNEVQFGQPVDRGLAGRAGKRGRDKMMVG